MESVGAGEAEGAAAGHGAAAREEAARKLLSNADRVLLDLTNPVNMNIDGKPLTQSFTLKRVPYDDQPHVDGFLRELTRRLLGTRAAFLQVALADAHQAAAWVAASKYLDGRIQSTAEQKQGRTPDMSPAAAAATKAVMAEMRKSAAPLAARLTGGAAPSASPSAAPAAVAMVAPLAAPLSSPSVSGGAFAEGRRRSRLWCRLVTASRSGWARRLQRRC